MIPEDSEGDMKIITFSSSTEKRGTIGSLSNVVRIGSGIVVVDTQDTREVQFLCAPRVKRGTNFVQSDYHKFWYHLLKSTKRVNDARVLFMPFPFFGDKDEFDALLSALQNVIHAWHNSEQIADKIDLVFHMGRFQREFQFPNVPAHVQQVMKRIETDGFHMVDNRVSVKLLTHDDVQESWKHLFRQYTTFTMVVLCTDEEINSGNVAGALNRQSVHDFRETYTPLTSLFTLDERFRRWRSVSTVKTMNFTYPPGVMDLLGRQVPLAKRSRR